MEMVRSLLNEAFPAQKVTWAGLQIWTMMAIWIWFLLVMTFATLTMAWAISAKGLPYLFQELMILVRSPLQILIMTETLTSLSDANARETG